MFDIVSQHNEILGVTFDATLVFALGYVHCSSSNKPRTFFYLKLPKLGKLI